MVNIACGRIVNKEGLVSVLEARQVVGTGLDVHINEPKVHGKLGENWMLTLLSHIAVCSNTSWANLEVGN